MWSMSGRSSRRRRARSSGHGSGTAKHVAALRCCSDVTPRPRSRWRPRTPHCRRWSAPACRPRCSNAGRTSWRPSAKSGGIPQRGGGATCAVARVLVFARGRTLGDQVMSVLRLNPWLASAGIGVSIPIYEGGALQAKVQIATAQQAQAVARYGAVVLTAFREVETSLANEQLLAFNCRWIRRPSTTAPKPCGSRHPVQGRAPGPAVGGPAPVRCAGDRSGPHQAAECAASQPGAAAPGAGRPLRR